MTNKLINNMRFSAAKSYNKSSEVPQSIKTLWEQSIRSQLMIELNLLLQTKHPLNGGFTLIHNARTNEVKVIDSILRNKSNIDYKLTKLIFANDIYNIDKTINKSYFEILVKILLNNIIKIS